MGSEYDKRSNIYIIKRINQFNIIFTNNEFINNIDTINN